MKNKFNPARIVLIGCAVVFISAPAFSQSCALCYTQAAAAGHRMIEAIRSGIIVLMIPPAFMSVGISVLAYRKRNQFKPDETGEHKETDNLKERW